MKVLGIETSCDETAAAVVEIIERAMNEARVTWDDLGGIAVTIGPGLAGSLLTGVNVAKAISLGRGLPITGVNHLEGHIYANWLTGDSLDLPVVCLIVSGGHSDLVLVRGHHDYVLLGQTRDDAAGEAFDKASRLLGLGYPGGPAIERAAKSGTASVPLPRAWLKGSHDFSFSGLKTALLRLVEDNKIPSPQDAAASFQEAVVDVLVTKTVAAAREYHVKQVLLAGGVAANSHLRQSLTEASPLPVLVPEPILCTDNAAMIAACGYFQFCAGKVDSLDMDVIPNLRLT